jgi:AraC family transcriptional regulator of adaptative response / DNA-3-methyladenine glycosylase II
VLDAENCYRVVQSKDARFDGWFVTAVTSTGIYCRPSCPAVTPKRVNVVFHPSAAAAHRAGFRACKRCRPDAAPGSPHWNTRADLVGRAMRLIADGVVDREGVSGLAARLGYSERQIHRQLMAEVGAGAQALARAQRAQTARVLLETSELPVSQVAFAAGFASLRQYNDTVRAIFATTPTGLRAAASSRQPAVAAGTLTVRLPYRTPLDLTSLLAFLQARTVPGIEECDGPSYRRTLRLPFGWGIVSLQAGMGRGPAHVSCTLQLEDLRDVSAAVQRCRRLLDLDADPAAVDDHLRSDPWFAPLVTRSPGHRSPGTVDVEELAIRAVLGQQASLATTRTWAARLVTALGSPLPAPSGSLSRLFPTIEALAAADPSLLPVPNPQRRALHTLAEAATDGRLPLHTGGDWDHTSAALLALPGIDTWTASYVRMRALGDPDVFLAGDTGRRHPPAQSHQSTRIGEAGQRAQRWSPWRSYATHHLWAAVAPPTHLPTRPLSDEEEVA